MWEQIRSNKRRAAGLVIVMAALLFVSGYAIGEVLAPGFGPAGLVMAFIIWIILTLTSYFGGDSIFLAVSGAKRIKPADHPVLYNIVEEMKIASGLPRVPDVYIIDDPAPNAFATGRKPETASVAVTSGLLERLDRDELQGVVAHEIGHIKNRDILLMIMVGIMMGTIVMLADIGTRFLIYGGGRRRTSSRDSGQAQAIIMLIAVILMILAPIIAQFIYFAISRKREYLADATSAQLTRYPEGLASALEKISRPNLKLKSANRAMAPMYIVNPLKVTAKGLSDLTSTHPPISKRVKILRAMAGGAGLPAYNEAFRKVTGRPVGVIPFSAMDESTQIETRQKRAEDQRNRLDRFRETTDLLWKLNQYVFIACVCGTNLKIPPEYTGKTIHCPHCNTPHDVDSSNQPGAE